MSAPIPARSAALEAVLAGDLALTRWHPKLDDLAISELCRQLREPSHDKAWATTPWGRTLPRSCVGTAPDRYRGTLALQPIPLLQQMEELFFQPIATLFSDHFGTPLKELELEDGTRVPGWALREMANGGGIPEHCERDWNPVNLIENGTLLPAAFEPRFQMSFLYGVDSATTGGELQISTSGDHVKLNPGELLLFNAGYHRHRVCPTGGPSQRVVLGGFLRLHRRHTHLHCYV